MNGGDMDGGAATNEGVGGPVGRGRVGVVVIGRFVVAMVGKNGVVDLVGDDTVADVTCDPQLTFSGQSQRVSSGFQ